MVQFLTMEFKKRQRYKLMMRVVAWEKIIVLHVRHAFWCNFFDVVSQMTT